MSPIYGQHEILLRYLPGGRRLWETSEFFAFLGEEYPGPARAGGAGT